MERKKINTRTGEPSVTAVSRRIVYALVNREFSWLVATRWSECWHGGGERSRESVTSDARSLDDASLVSHVTVNYRQVVRVIMTNFFATDY